MNWKIFSIWLGRIEPFFLTWLKDFVFFLLKKKTQRIWLFYVSQTCTFFCKKKYFSKKKKKTTQRIDPLLSLRLSKWNFFEIRIRLTELIFFQYDSQNWKTFFCMTLWIDLFFKKYDVTHRIEPLFMNIFSRWLKELKSFFLTQRIEPFLFSNVTQRIEIFFLKMSQRI